MRAMLRRVCSFYPSTHPPPAPILHSTRDTLQDTQKVRDRNAGSGWISYLRTGVLYTNFSTTVPKISGFPENLGLAFLVAAMFSYR